MPHPLQAHCFAALGFVGLDFAAPDVAVLAFVFAPDGTPGLLVVDFGLLDAVLPLGTDPAAFGPVLGPRRSFSVF